MNKAVIAGLTEILRTAVMAVIPLAILDIQQGKFNWKTWGIAGLIAILSGIDKWLHKLGEGIKGNGLTGF